MKLLTKFRGKKGEMVPIRPDLHDILLGKCSTIWIIWIYTNLFTVIKRFIFTWLAVAFVNIDDIKYQLRKLSYVNFSTLF